jgi:hypothetical protein
MSIKYFPYPPEEPPEDELDLDEEEIFYDGD